MTSPTFSRIALALVATLPACGGSPTVQVEEARSDVARIAAPASDDVATLAGDSATFGVALFSAVKGSGQNALVSPWSASSALGMAYAGAKGQTATQMAAALRFTLPADRLFTAFDALDLALATRASDDTKDQAGVPLSLQVVNASWGQKGYSFVPAYLDTLAQTWGAGVNLVDFAGAPDAARATINSWVADRTQDRIRDLLPPNSVDSSTRLVLTNAVYFRAAWQNPFESRLTGDASFTKADGSSATVPTMHQTESLGWAEATDYKAVELPFKGGKLAFVAVLPAATLDAFEATLDGAKLRSIVAGLAPAEVSVSLPKFKFTWGTNSLTDALQGMGMTDAFTPAADFTGIHTPDELFISDVLQKTFIDVNEQGTEAAAATAVVMTEGAVMSPKVITLDRPFLFFIVDKPTGTVLFLGHLMAP